MERPGKADAMSTFNRLCGQLLTPQERSVLKRGLQAYQTSHQLTTFISATYFLWCDPGKLQLLPFVRQVIAPRDRQLFDEHLGIHEGLVVRGPRSDRSSSMASSRAGKRAAVEAVSRGAIHVVKVASAASPRMGFSIRGGSDFGLGIYVSQVEPDSPAEQGGLRCGDQILESNGVELEQASSRRAADFLSGTHTHTLVVRRTNRIPEWKVTKERILWYDVAARKLVARPTGEESWVEGPGSEVKDLTERKVVLRLSRDRDFVGLNVRGGKEFGVGVYISRVDPGGLAERGGVEVGDRLVQVNKHRLEKASHGLAVRLLRSSKQLVLTLWAVARFPAYKELVTEYVWSDTGSADGYTRTTRVHTAELHPEPHVPSRRKSSHVTTQRTKARESRIDRSPRDSGIDLNGVSIVNPPPDYSNDDDDSLGDEETLPEERKSFFPRDQDIIFKGDYRANWRHVEQKYGGEDTPSVSTTAPSLSTQRRASNASGPGSESDQSSDEDMDYTTFLERQARRDRKRESSSQDTNSRRGTVTTIVVGGNGQTSTTHVRPAEPVLVTKNADATKATDSTRSPAAEPVLLRTAESTTSLHTQPTLLKTAESTASLHTEPTLLSTQNTRTAASEPTLVTTQNTVSAEPVLLKTTHSNRSVPGAGADQDGARRQENGYEEVRVGLATNSTGRGTVVSVGASTQGPGLREDTHVNDIYAVVSKPPKRPEQRVLTNNTTTTSTISAGPSTSANARRSLSAINDDSSDDSRGSDSTLSDGDDDDHHHHSQRHHRTHIYHVSGSPGTIRRHPTPAATTHNGLNSHDEPEEPEPDYMVVTEVMDEVAALPPSPPADYRRGSVTSSSLASIAGEGVRGGGRGDVDALTEEIRRLEARQSSISSREVFSLTQLQPVVADRTDTEKEEASRKASKWSAIKKRLTSSMRIKKGDKSRKPVAARDALTNQSQPKSLSPAHSFGSVRKKGLFERSFGSQMMSQQTEDKYNLMMVEERARHLLNKDESDAVLRHIKTYLDQKDVERLATVLLAILDKPDKLQLLKDIRGVVLARDVGRFDSLVAQHQATVSDHNATTLHLPLSPVHRADSTTKPRPKRLTTVLDADGHFHIQPEIADSGDRNRPIPTVTPRAGPPTNNARPVFAPVATHGGHQSHSNSSTPALAGATNTRGSTRADNDVSRTRPPRPEWRDDVEVIIVEKLPPPPPPTPPPPEEGFVVYVSKQKKNLGLIVCGGAGDHMDSSVRIEMVMPWGAAADDERIQSGMHILSVDDQSVKGLTQAEAIAILKRCFNDVTNVNMKLRLKKP